MISERRKTERRTSTERRNGIDRRVDMHYAVQWLESDERRSWNLSDRRRNDRRFMSRRTGAPKDSLFKKITKRLSFLTDL